MESMEFIGFRLTKFSSHGSEKPYLSLPGQRRRRRLVRTKSAAAQTARQLETTRRELGAAFESATSTASGPLETIGCRKSGMTFWSFDRATVRKQYLNRKSKTTYLEASLSGTSAINGPFAIAMSKYRRVGETELFFFGWEPWIPLKISKDGKTWKL